VTTNNPPGWRDVPLEGLHTGTTPTPMKSIKVSYYALKWLWSLVVVPSCTKMRCVWQHRGPLVSTNKACLTFRLQFRTTADTLNSWYVVARSSYRWIWPGVPYQMIYGGIPQFTVSGAIVLWQPTIHLLGHTTGGFTHWDRSNTNEKY
jgi:hypothetical protein